MPSTGDKTREAHRLATDLHAFCVGKPSKSRTQEAEECAFRLQEMYPKWKFLPVMGVGFYLYVPYDDYQRLPTGVHHTASRVEGVGNDGRAYVFKDRRGQNSGEWIAKPTHPDFGLLVKTEPTPTVWDRLGNDDDFGK